ncbi:MAG: alpha/beta hydrolase [Bacteroidales bacterium]|nr:alpha/beta hydrolase [Bacteroidales bacterium]
MKNIILLNFVFLLLLSSCNSNAQQVKSINFPADDGVTVTADLYLTKNLNAQFIILFHQAMFSRGEYLEIAPKLNELGFNCMAVDQRSGLKVNGIINETHKDAKSKGKSTKYTDAFPDLEAALTYVKKNYSPDKLIVWGSSYSSSLVFIFAAKHPEIDAVLSFSPGEYFKFENKRIADWTKDVKCPVFVTSSKKEAKDCSLIFKESKNKISTQFIPEVSGFHGSKALWKSKSGNESYWFAVTQFLSNFTETKKIIEMKSMSPNLMVHDVNKTVDYYKNFFDFQLIMSVPEKGQYEWAMMKNGNVTIMFQEKESLSEELTSLQNKPLGATMNLYFQTKNIEELYEKVKKTEKIAKELGTTFYGTEEFTMKDLNGYFLTFAEDNE